MASCEFPAAPSYDAAWLTSAYDVADPGFLIRRPSVVELNRCGQTRPSVQLIYGSVQYSLRFKAHGRGELVCNWFNILVT